MYVTTRAEKLTYKKVIKRYIHTNIDPNDINLEIFKKKICTYNDINNHPLNDIDLLILDNAELYLLFFKGHIQKIKQVYFIFDEYHILHQKGEYGL